MELKYRCLNPIQMLLFFLFSLEKLESHFVFLEISLEQKGFVIIGKGKKKRRVQDVFEGGGAEYLIYNYRETSFGVCLLCPYESFLHQGQMYTMYFEYHQGHFGGSICPPLI